MRRKSNNFDFADIPLEFSPDEYPDVEEE